MARLIDAKAGKKVFSAIAQPAEYKGVIHMVVPISEIDKLPTVDAVEVVRCKECRFANQYKRMDGKTGYYCQFCGHSFKYGTNCERLYNPVKESDDFCSYGERKDGDGNG